MFVQIDQYDVDTEKAVDKISRQLLEHEIITEGYGGEVPIVPVSCVVHSCVAELVVEDRAVRLKHCSVPVDVMFSEATSVSRRYFRRVKQKTPRVD